ncbi:hypothetical protein VNI00_011021 [Paramarasmius palmivorus]|uniref:F-box domain-containing protein n=1 Tax=Paramarasmius palmivorus TaxID=297713 RepID=A0AAW0CFN8_9AGAR
MDSHLPADSSMGHTNADSYDEFVQELATLDAELEALNARLESVARRKEEIRGKYQAARAASGLSLVQKLPTEILQSIFSHCNLTPFSIGRASEGPILFGRICRKWRNVALGTPELWRSIHIVLPSAEYPSDRNIASRSEGLREGVKMWLSRAGELPLRISAHYNAREQDARLLNEAAKVVEVLVPYLKRCSYFRLDLPLQCIQSLNDIPGEEFPVLETALVKLKDPFSLPEPSNLSQGNPVFFLSDSPRLHSLCLRDDRPSRYLRPTVIWGNLRSLSLKLVGTRPVEIFSIISQCTNLHRFELIVFYVDRHSGPPSPPPEEHITLPHLQDFNLSIPCDFLHEVFNMLVLPSLRTLSLENHQSVSFAEVFGAIKELCLRSSNSLHKLTLNLSPDCFKPMSSFLDFLRSIPSLFELEFGGRELEIAEFDQFFEVMTLDADREPESIPCPNLRRLVIPDSTASDEGKLVEFIASRCEVEPSSPVVALDSVRISTYRKTLKNALEIYMGRVDVDLRAHWYNNAQMGLPISFDVFDEPL